MTSATDIKTMLPLTATILEVFDETPDIKTFRIKPDDEQEWEKFQNRKSGQVAELSVFGTGESVISITSPPTQPDYLEFTIKRTGVVTDMIHTFIAGDKIGIRGPYGNGFPVDDWKGKNLVFVAGGFALAPARSVLNYALDKRDDYGHIDLFYGARTPGDLCFKWEYDRWKNEKDMFFDVTVDCGDDAWTGKVGVVPALVKDANPSPENTIAIICGPPIMIKFTLQELNAMGFQPEQIVTTLEGKMQCCVGLCGRCNVGSKFICKDGPVFTLAELNAINGDF
ncbi:MAG: hydrogenase [Candidatus Aquicultor secundus]|nr:FAD/NAD(P)-binding protein [Candidatus Aquicultor secundus]OIO84957.1 MAG: hydrogenase [Candidatus Aquicultor secundus]PIU26694.1 MAG: hydrogenase [Candidatus Aquicultor secundus]